SRSRSKIYRLIEELSGERVPTIDLAHADLAGGEQRPQQHGRGVHRWQHRLRFDSSLELLVQSFNGVGGTSATPLTERQPREREEPVAGFLQAVRDGTVLEPPFAKESRKNSFAKLEKK